MVDVDERVARGDNDATKSGRARKEGERVVRQILDERENGIVLGRYVKCEDNEFHGIFEFFQTTARVSYSESKTRSVLWMLLTQSMFAVFEKGQLRWDY